MGCMIMNKKRALALSIIFFVIGIIMFVVMISFIWYAANHPEGISPFPLLITRIFYFLYLIVTILLLSLSVVFFSKYKQK